MRTWRTLLCGMGILAALAGCIPSQAQLQMERDLAEMKRRLAETERSAVALRQETSAQVQERLDTLGRTAAEQQANLDAARVELQSLAGRLEDLRRERSGSGEEMELLRDDLALKITALEDRLGKIEERLIELEEKKGAEPAPAKVPESPEALYQQGVEAIQKEGEFTRGRQLLETFMADAPQSPLAVNAMYWIGESYYGEKKYENAILQFQDVIQKFPDHPKAASAMLKQALAFDVMGDRKNARVILQKVIDSFPLSAEAKKARERLAEWEKGKKKS